MIDKIFFSRKKTMIIFGLLAIGAATLLYFGSERENRNVVINEVCADNFCAYRNSSGDYPDYVELYNMSEEDVSGLYLSDSRKNSKKYKVEEVIPSNDYYVVELSKYMENGFGISKGGEELFLSNEEGRIIDSVAIPELSFDVTYSRTVDGEGRFSTMSATPGGSNSDAVQVATSFIESPKFSIEDGFYDEGTKLKITSSPLVDIFYTDDGSIPNENSHKYKGEITLSDASAKDNIYANEIMYPTYIPPAYKIDKANVISAIAVNKFTGKKSRVETHTYFVGFDKKDVYKDMKIMSLVFDPEDLFGHDRGIYTLGKKYDEYKELGGFVDLPDDRIPSSFTDENGWVQYRSSYTNSESKGTESERRAHMTIFDEAHKDLFSQDIGVRIAGESTRASHQKSLNLYSREKYDGNEYFANSFFNNNEKKIRLRRCDSGVAYLEPFIQSVIGETGIPYQDSEPAAVFINGEYWGIYNLREKYDENYFKEHFGIPFEQLWTVKNSAVEWGDIGADEAYNSLIDRICELDMSDDEAYSSVESELDIDNMIDYYCILLFFNDQDINGEHNRFLFRTREPGAGAYSDGKWRFVAYDLDVTCENVENDTVSDYREIDEKMFLPCYFYSRPGFKERFYNRMVELTENELSYEHLSKKLSEWDKVYREQSIETYRRFNEDDYSEKDYERELSELDSFFKNRKEYVLKMLEKDIKEN